MSPNLQKNARKRLRIASLTRGNVAHIFSTQTSAAERLAGWPRRIRTSESVRELSDWNFVTTWPENRRKLGGGDPSRASCRDAEFQQTNGPGDYRVGWFLLDDDTVELNDPIGWEPLTHEIDRVWFEKATERLMPEAPDLP